MLVIPATTIRMLTFEPVKKSALIDQNHRIYNSGTSYHKDPGVYKLLGIDGSILTITDPEEHKQYRSIVGSLFSKKPSDDLAPVMATLLNRSAESMARQGREGNPSTIQRAYRSIVVSKAKSSKNS